MSNVINFAEAKADREARNADDLDITSEDGIDYIAEMMVYDIYTAFYEMGYDLGEDPNLFKDIVLVLEAIKSTAYRLNKKEYYIHEIAANIVDVSDEKLRELLDNFVENMVDIASE